MNLGRLLLVVLLNLLIYPVLSMSWLIDLKHGGIRAATRIANKHSLILKKSRVSTTSCRILLQASASRIRFRNRQCSNNFHNISKLIDLLSIARLSDHIPVAGGSYLTTFLLQVAHIKGLYLLESKDDYKHRKRRSADLPPFATEDEMLRDIANSLFHEKDVSYVEPQRQLSRKTRGFVPEKCCDNFNDPEYPNQWFYVSI